MVLFHLAYLILRLCQTVCVFGLFSLISLRLSLAEKGFFYYGVASMDENQ